MKADGASGLRKGGKVGERFAGVVGVGSLGCVWALWCGESGRSSHGFASVARVSGFYHIERSGSA